MQAQAFHEAAKGHGVVFGSTQDQSIMARHESASPGFIVFQNVDQQKHKFAGEFTRESIQHFIDRRSIGLFGEVGPDNIQLYLKPKLPIAYVFLESKDQQAEHAYITHVAKQFYNDVIVAMVNATEVLCFNVESCAST